MLDGGGRVMILLGISELAIGKIGSSGRTRFSAGNLHIAWIPIIPALNEASAGITGKN
jgi:hypothetical protein